MDKIKTDKKKYLILENKNLYMSILILAIPICLSNLLKSVHDIIDMYFVTGDTAIAAISFPSSVIMLSQALAIGFMVAGAALMSQALGANNKEKAKRISGQLLLLCILSGIIFNILLYLLIPNILELLGATPDEEMYKLSLQYVRIRSFEMVPLFAFYAFQASRQASGDTLTPVIFNIISIILNIVLTWYLVQIENMGVAGAAYATLAANILILPIAIFMLFKDKKADICIDLKDIKIDIDEIKLLVKIGIPSALSQAFSSLGFLFINGFIKRGFGEVVVAAFSVGNRINSLVLMPIMGIGGIIATFVGQNIGANNEGRARESIKCAMILVLIMMSVGGAILLPFRDVFSEIFLEEGSQSIELCSDYMFFLLTGLPLMGIFQVFIGAFQGAGYTKYAMVMSTIRLWAIRIPIVYVCIFILNLGSSCIWYTMTFSNFLSAIIGMILYKLMKFKKIDEINKDNEEDEKGEVEYGYC